MNETKIFTKLVDKSTFFHDCVGAIQVIDESAIQSMVDQFVLDSKESGFSGLSVGIDHLNDLTQEQLSKLSEIGIPLPTEAVAWVMSVEAKDDGLYGVITNWTDEGYKSIQDGSYKFISPVFMLDEAEILDPTPQKVPQFKPLRLNSVAFTNSPRMGVGMKVSLTSNGKGNKTNIAGDSIKIENKYKITNSTQENNVMTKDFTDFLVGLGVEISEGLDEAGILDLAKTKINSLTEEVEALKKTITELQEKNNEAEAEAEAEATNVANSLSISDVKGFISIYKKDKVAINAAIQKMVKKVDVKPVDKATNTIPTIKLDGAQEKEISEYMKSHPGVPKSVVMSRLA